MNKLLVYEKDTIRSVEQGKIFSGNCNLLVLKSFSVFVNVVHVVKKAICLNKKCVVFRVFIRLLIRFFDSGLLYIK